MQKTSNSAILFGCTSPPNLKDGQGNLGWSGKQGMLLAPGIALHFPGCCNCYKGPSVGFLGGYPGWDQWERRGGNLERGGPLNPINLNPEPHGGLTTLGLLPCWQELFVLIQFVIFLLPSLWLFPLCFPMAVALLFLSVTFSLQAPVPFPYMALALPPVPFVF